MRAGYANCPKETYISAWFFALYLDTGNYFKVFCFKPLTHRVFKELAFETFSLRLKIRSPQNIVLKVLL